MTEGTKDLTGVMKMSFTIDAYFFEKIWKPLWLGWGGFTFVRDKSGNLVAWIRDDFGNFIVVLEF